ncbi:ATP-binding protein [Shewanella electrodiphila]|uniref:histidine kinase n=1 Tax=Shewanella electrodiphila TaxID=934143 RepID=A0ABT0KJH8_9GAMM|nr:ATP-binding protein [Shewanella electrodiphila]MCL1043898.1 ATP-binding protein [Shewanella electrodiphila]
MKRLFISLYLLLSLSFLGIGWTLDSLWQQQVEDNDNLDSPLIAFGLLLAQQPKADRQAQLDKINRQFPYPLQLFEKNEIALSGEVVFSETQIITTTADKSHELQFIAVGDQVLMAGPVDIDPRGQLRNIFTIGFYLSLAFVALIWVWPLSKDLKTLKKATQNFGEAKWNTRIELNASSQVAPLANTFNDMAQHISDLIDNQKHLSNAVSHEIRTPLARLKFALALLPQYCQPKSDEQRRQNFLDEMQLDIKEMETLLQELLTYASLEVQQEPSLEKCELISMIEELSARLTPLSDKPINFHYARNEMCIMAEPPLVERAIQNLITNAQRYTQTSIELYLSYDERLVFLSVVNDGEAIPEEDQEKLFEPFYRSKSQHKGNKGHGLGLAIIKRIMHRHKGRVNLVSDEDNTSFTLIWPR